MALSAKADIKQRSIDLEEVPLKAGYKPYQGSIIVLGPDGYGRPALARPSCVAKGVAQKTVDNSSTGTLPGYNTDGGLKVTVKRGVHGPFATSGTSVTLAHRGQVCYLVDDNTVTMDTSGKSAAGVVADVDSEGVWVEFNPSGRQS